MSCILHIETSTSACSVAVSEDGQNVFNKEDLNGHPRRNRMFGKVSPEPERIRRDEFFCHDAFSDFKFLNLVNQQKRVAVRDDFHNLIFVKQCHCMPPASAS